MTVKEAVGQLAEACRTTGCDECDYAYHPYEDGDSYCSLSNPLLETPDWWDRTDIRKLDGEGMI